MVRILPLPLPDFNLKGRSMNNYVNQRDIAKSYVMAHYNIFARLVLDFIQQEKVR